MHVNAKVSIPVTPFSHLGRKRDFTRWAPEKQLYPFSVMGPQSSHLPIYKAISRGPLTPLITGLNIFIIYKKKEGSFHPQFRPLIRSPFGSMVFKGPPWRSIDLPLSKSLAPKIRFFGTEGHTKCQYLWMPHRTFRLEERHGGLGTPKRDDITPIYGTTV